MEEERGSQFATMTEARDAAATRVATLEQTAQTQSEELSAMQTQLNAGGSVAPEASGGLRQPGGVGRRRPGNRPPTPPPLIPRFDEAVSLGFARDNVYMDLKNANEAAYVATAFTVLPNGMMGLLVCAIFAATMSSMDSGLNRSAGIMVRNFYLPVINPGASEERQLNLGKLITGLLGLTMTVMGLLFSTLQTLPLFELILLIAALVGMPTAIPLFYGIFVKRVPAWAAWSTVVVGLGFGALSQWLLPSAVVAR